MSVYAVALLNIDDREVYARYEAGFMDIFDRYGGRLLAVEEAPDVKEGEWPYTRTVLIEFPDAAAFDAWYDSEEYQSLAEHRFASSRGSVAVLRSLD